LVRPEPPLDLGGRVRSRVARGRLCLHNCRLIIAGLPTLLLGLALSLSATAQQAPAASSSASPSGVNVPTMEIVTTPTRSSVPAREESSDALVVTQSDIEAGGQPMLDDVLR